MPSSGARMGWRMQVAGMLCAVAFGSCQAVEPIRVRTMDPPPRPDIPVVCPNASVGPFRVVIDPTAPDPVWGTHIHDESRFEIIWPPGFTVRTDTPVFALVDSFGNTVVHNGGVIERAGGVPGDPTFVCSIGGTYYPLQ